MIIPGRSVLRPLVHCSVDSILPHYPDKGNRCQMRRTLGQELIGLTTPLTREYLHILKRPGFDNPHGAAKGQDLTPIAVTGVSFVLTHLLIIYLFDMGLILYPVTSMETILCRDYRVWSAPARGYCGMGVWRYPMFRDLVPRNTA
jgi:hypothetical protein